MIRRPPRSTLSSSSAASDVYKRQPFQCVPHLIALSCDVESKLSEIAHTLVQTVHEKRAEFCADSHAMQGVDLAYLFRRHLHVGTEESMALMLKDGHVGIKRLYQLLRGHRPHRVNFLQSMVNRVGSFHDALEKRPSISYSIFLAQQLTNLPYSVREEPLYVVYAINHVLALHRDTILFELSKEVEDYVDQEPQESSKNGEERSLKEVAAVCILILVKQHLKQVHFLSDVACEEFQPSIGTKVSEKALPHFNDREEPVLDLQCVQPLMLPEARETREVAYHLLRELVDNDLSKDFSFDQRKQKTRKRKSTGGTGDELAAKTPGTNGKGSAQKRGRPSSKKKSRKRMALESDSEDAGDDNEDDSDF
eukprot:TRINITY_DN4302_c0_g1_i3.p1 TRINITY_DN4302_c0_g1~~TRINITY_DN4302_c0_g1_i3.p1  ORF type:complete len:365 (-),score=53.18 TRINITY_DN4302_c0_g1_i3:163-1257(-)